MFLVNGTADSLIIAELSNWNGKAIKIPRIEVSSCNRRDITQAGVYFLFCKDDDGTDSVYIGEAENVKERLLQHLRDFQSEKEKYEWDLPASQTDGELLYITSGSVNATGRVTTEGFVVFEGATVNEKSSEKSLTIGMIKLREKLFRGGKVQNLVTTEDILFSSSSAAADFVLGYSVSGPRTWKTKDGRSLKDIENE